MKKVTMVNVLGRVCGYFNSVPEAHRDGVTSAVRIIDWERGEVHVPIVEENTWHGDWALASPERAAALMKKHEVDNPMSFNYTKIRRRVEDALRKTQDEGLILETALRLGVKISE